MTTSSVGINASGGYCGNGPWFRRSVTGGPEPKSYLLQLWARTRACALFVPSSAAAARATVLFKNSLRRMRVAPSSSRLEVQLQSKLNLSLRNNRRRNHPCSSRSIGDGSIRLRKHRVVEGVEKLRAKFHIDPFSKIKVLAR